jgi:hypothetical protein
MCYFRDLTTPSYSSS